MVNLVGMLERRFRRRVHVDGARNVAEAAAAAGVRALVHVSAIGADAASPSAYGRTKGEGEAAVRAAFPAATILRPSIMFGREDQFINRFAGDDRSGAGRAGAARAARSSSRSMSPMSPQAIVAALADPEACGGHDLRTGRPRCA